MNSIEKEIQRGVRNIPHHLLISFVRSTNNRITEIQDSVGKAHLNEFAEKHIAELREDLRILNKEINDRN